MVTCSKEWQVGIDNIYQKCDQPHAKNQRWSSEASQPLTYCYHCLLSHAMWPSARIAYWVVLMQVLKQTIYHKLQIGLPILCKRVKVPV